MKIKSRIQYPFEKERRFAEGTRHMTKESGPLEILKINGPESVIVKFLNTGSVRNDVRLKHIKSGEVRDYTRRTANGGYLGLNYNIVKLLVSKKELKKLKSRHRHMLDRCNNKKCPDYPLYGGQGVRVCERWYCLANYILDVINLPGYDKDLLIDNKISLDKDKLQKDVKEKIYSPETCVWLTSEGQAKEIDYTNSKRASMKHFMLYDNDRKVYEVWHGVNECAKFHNITREALSRALKQRGKIINHYVL